MKHFILSAVFIFISGMGFSQESGFTIKGGVNFNSYAMEDFKTDKNIGFHIGATYEQYFSDVLGVEAGLFLDTRGSKVGKVDTAKSTILGITVPILAKTRIDIESFAVFFNVGPFTNISFVGLQDAKDVTFGSNAYRRFGWGLTFGGGVEIGKFMVGAGYDLGLSKVAKESEMKARAIKIGVGYKL